MDSKSSLIGSVLAQLTQTGEICRVVDVCNGLNSYDFVNIPTLANRCWVFVFVAKNYKFTFLVVNIRNTTIAIKNNIPK